MSAWLVLSFEELGSTNDKAKELSANPPAQKFVVTAQKQTSGRGRRGRVWQGLDGNLFMSQGFELELQHLSDMVFIISLSLLEALRLIAPNLKIELKWPNDVLVNGSKVSGILLEKAENEYIIAGIGVNVKAAPNLDNQASYSATSLKSCGIEVSATEVLGAYLKAFDKNFATWQTSGFEMIRNKWLQNAKGLQQEIKVNLEKEVICGIFRGIAQNGALLLEKDGKTEQIFAGDVFYKEEK